MSLKTASHSRRVVTIDPSVRAQLRQELEALLGPRHFQAGERHEERIGVARPRSVAEVQQIARLTAPWKVPLIPRAATSNPFAHTTWQDGLVVSLEGLEKLRSFSLHRRTAIVGPGLIWRTLIEQLAPNGLMPRVYPSSEGFSTVGGFVAQGGVGIGSYQFGDISHSVKELRIVDASGEVRTVAGGDIPLVVGAEGRTGLVVQITLLLQDLVPMAPVVAVFDSFEKAERCLTGVAAQPLPIWSVHLMGPIGSDVQSRSWPAMALPHERHAAVFSLRQSDLATAGATLSRTIRESGGREIEVHGANEEWLVQFASLEAQGTTPVPMQFQLPPGRAAEFDGSIRADLRSRLAVEGVVTDGGKAVVLRYFFAERPVEIDENVTVGHDLLALAKRLGGRIYSTGAMFPEEAPDVFGAERLKSIRTFRRAVDPDGRLNPGLAF